ncbi:MAG: histidine kinase dimerization/phospho-acceptor domain-containing protein [Pseudomonadota bacterium]
MEWTEDVCARVFPTASLCRLAFAAALASLSCGLGLAADGGAPGAGGMGGLIPLACLVLVVLGVGLGFRVRTLARKVIGQAEDLRRREREVQRKDQEQAQVARQWRVLADGLPEPMARCDVAGRIAFANAALAAWLDGAPESLSGRRLTEAGVVDGDALDGLIGQVVRRGSVAVAWLAGPGKDAPGTRVVVLPERDDGGRVAFVQVIFGITEGAGQAGEDGRVEQARWREETLSSTGHALRNPLNGILGHAQLLARDPALAASHQAGIAAILASGQQLLGLVNGLGRPQGEAPSREEEGPVPAVRDQSATEPSLPGGWPIPPPLAELLALGEAARAGNMRALIAGSQRVVGLDPAYRAFADHLRGLAETYQSRSASAFVQHYLDEHGR